MAKKKTKPKNEAKAQARNACSVQLVPCQEINYGGNTGVEPCEHIKSNVGIIPGLDADFCTECRTWWVNVKRRARTLESKSGQVFSANDNVPAQASP